VPRVHRIIVGASGSPGSLRALRYARHLARDLDATLAPVLARLPPDGDLADRRTSCEELRRIWAQDARQRLQEAQNLAWGDLPADLPVQPVIRRGQPGPVLVDTACRPATAARPGNAPWRAGTSVLAPDANRRSDLAG
jgi:nucleotide-binding universal stress UspA family protein